MDILFTITYYLFVIHLVRVIIFWLHLWQIKEYRLDRLLVHIRETGQGKAIIFGLEPLVKLGILVAYIVSVFYPLIYPFVPFAVFAIYLYELIKFGLDFLQKKVKFPVFTPKLVVIALMTIISVFGLLLLPLLDKFFWIVLVDKAVIFLIALFMGLLSFPSMFYKDTQINKAITKLSKHKDVLVIGITGSYGKGSTKEYMYTILSSKFNTLKTPSTHNTPIGIARTILSQLNKSTEIFVVEMGAYKIGEIADMCNFVRPKIGVLTAVNDQHVSLFGSIENTMKAKYELIESLPTDGTAIFNGNNDNSLKLYRQTKRRKKYLYYMGEKNAVDAQIYASKVRVHPTFLTFDVTVGKKEFKNLHVNLVGDFHIQNILPAIFVANSLKMTKAEIDVALRKIAPLYKTMQPFKEKKTGLLLIDDTYNANPASVLSAVEYLSHQKGKKALVLQPMIELGKHGTEDHYTVGNAVGKVCNYLFVTNKNFYSQLQKGINDSGGRCEIILASPKKIADDLLKRFGKKDVVVFEGKESQAAFDLIPHEQVE